MNKVCRLLATALVSVFALVPCLSTAGEDPVTVVENLQAALVGAMKGGDSMDYDARYALLAPVALETHDFPFIAQIAMGRHWRQLTNEEQQQYVNAFEEMSIASYASRFERYSGERFVVVETYDNPRGGRVVICELRREGEQPLLFEYHLRQTGGDWRIVNIVVDGVSDLALKRAEYSGVLSEFGFSGLLDDLANQVDTARKRSQ